MKKVTTTHKRLTEKAKGKMLAWLKKLDRATVKVDTAAIKALYYENENDPELQWDHPDLPEDLKIDYDEFVDRANSVIYV